MKVRKLTKRLPRKVMAMNEQRVTQLVANVHAAAYADGLADGAVESVSWVQVEIDSYHARTRGF